MWLYKRRSDYLYTQSRHAVLYSICPNTVEDLSWSTCLWTPWIIKDIWTPVPRILLAWDVLIYWTMDSELLYLPLNYTITRSTLRGVTPATCPRIVLARHLHGLHYTPGTQLWTWCSTSCYWLIDKNEALYCLQGYLQCWRGSPPIHSTCLETAWPTQDHCIR